MARHHHGVAAYAPMYMHTFKLLQPQKLTEAEKFNIEHPSPDQLPKIPDKLRYYRYLKGLKQSDVADYAEIYRSTYIHYENGINTYPLDKLGKIAELFDTDIVDLLDSYHLFLWRGQGGQLKAMRKQNGWTQRHVAQLTGVAIGTVKRWESNHIVISRASWEKIMVIYS